jgi:murein L,D-transpeptidase YafK
MMKVLLPFFLLASLQADNILSVYRTHGIEEIKKELDLQLTNHEYWLGTMQGKDLRFGYLEGVNSALICEKNRSKLTFYKRSSAQQSFELQKDFDAYTGKIDGDKQREGDLKTPLGVYNLTKKLDNLDPFYGPLAYVTSYPNFYDRVRGKNGSGIWIHGLPDNAEREPYTRGCIAIENSDITCMSKKLTLEKSVVIIAEEKQEPVTPETYSNILAQLYQWRYAWLYNHLDDYLGFYAEDFKRHDGMDLRRFKQYKTQVFAYNDEKTIRFNNINIIPYPSEEKSLFIIWFDETYQSKRLTFTGEKSLIVRYADGQFQIVVEK